MTENCSLRVKMAVPRRTLRNETLKNSLKNFIVTLVSKYFNVISLRTMWEVTEDDITNAELNIWQKRQEVEAIVKSFDCVRLFFSCITGMESSTLRRKLAQRRRRIDTDPTLSGSDTDNDFSSFSDSATIIPG